MRNVRICVLGCLIGIGCGDGFAPSEEPVGGPAPDARTDSADGSGGAAEAEASAEASGETDGSSGASGSGGVAGAGGSAGAGGKVVDSPSEAPCVPKTCMQVNPSYLCGKVDDGCGGKAPCNYPYVPGWPCGPEFGPYYACGLTCNVPNVPHPNGPPPMPDCKFNSWNTGQQWCCPCGDGG